jgi:BrnA antitoxin of type II toxin-antitoxin system
MAFRQPERSRAKTRITIRIDGEVLDWFRNQVHEAGGGSYQTLMNRALRDHVTRREGTLAETLRRVVREELARKKRRRRPRKAAPKKRARARQRPRARRKPPRKSPRKRHK